MGNWFKKADFYLRTASQHYDIASTQDEDYNIALTCYFLQQSIEFNIKGLIEYYCDTEFDKSHNISNNLVILEREKDKVKNYDKIENTLLELDSNASEISSWNSESRYNFDFVKTRAMIQKVSNIADSLNKFTSLILNNEDNIKSNIEVSLYKMDLIGKTYKEKCEVVRKFMKEFYCLDIPQEYNIPIYDDIFWINEHSEDDVKGHCGVGYMIGYTSTYVQDNPEKEYYGGSFGFSSFEVLLDMIIQFKTLDKFLSYGANFMRHA